MLTKKTIEIEKNLHPTANHIEDEIEFQIAYMCEHNNETKIGGRTFSVFELETALDIIHYCREEMKELRYVDIMVEEA